MASAHAHRPGTHWFVSDGFIWDDLPASYRTEPGRPLECSSKLFLFNPQQHSASVRVRFYHVDRPPTEVAVNVLPGAIETLELARLSEVPHRQSFWIVVQSDVPVLPQARHEDFTFWDPVPDALAAVTPYPGPLQEETTWIFPDCFQGGPQSWYERETLTLLNPHPRPVKAQIRYFLRGRQPGAEEEIEIPGERVAALEVWERSPRLLDQPHGVPLRIQGDYAVRIDATAPVIAQTTRRARWTGRPSIVGARSTMGVPVSGCSGVQVFRRSDGDAATPEHPNTRTPEHLTWYYPGGSIIDRNILPRGQNCDVTWNLLFVHNPSEADTARVTVRFHNREGTVRGAPPFEVPPRQSNLQWLHMKPWLGEYTQLDEPWAMTVTADRPVVPEVCDAEFEMWSQVCPGAMTAVNFYPGPLTEERTWWLGIGQAGGADEISAEWQQSYHLFNPGQDPVRVALSFLGIENQETLEHSVDLPAGAVAQVGAEEIAGLPVGQPFAVRADADRPFCAQLFTRTFTRGLPHTRGMASQMGLPMRLG